MAYKPTMPHPVVTEVLAEWAESGTKVASRPEVLRAALPHLKKLTDTLRKIHGPADEATTPRSS